MSKSRLINRATIKKLLIFKDVRKYNFNYQAAFDKVIDFLTDISYHTWQSTEKYFQATILMNIRIECSAFVLAIQKNWKDKTTNLAKMVL